MLADPGYTPTGPPPPPPAPPPPPSIPVPSGPSFPVHHYIGDPDDKMDDGMANDETFMNAHRSMSVPALPAFAPETERDGARNLIQSCVPQEVAAPQLSEQQVQIPIPSNLVFEKG